MAAQRDTKLSNLNSSNTLFGNARNWGRVSVCSDGLKGYEAVAYLVNEMYVNGSEKAAMNSDLAGNLVPHFECNAACWPGGDTLSMLSDDPRLFYATYGIRTSSSETYSNLWIYTQPFNLG